MVSSSLFSNLQSWVDLHFDKHKDPETQTAELHGRIQWRTPSLNTQSYISDFFGFFEFFEFFGSMLKPEVGLKLLK